jgi:phosphoribosylaminoimidazolecarboxamide formyltransferase/IMP cyclohydrolase
MESKKITRSLISVYNKEGLDEIVNRLVSLNIEICSTGGTYDYLRKMGVNAVAVEDITGYPSILGGRVKTLHPKIFGGILGRRENEGDMKSFAEYEIPQIDLVIVDLYPFEATVAAGLPHEDIIEKIDIGGISLIRAAAKNYRDVIIVPSKESYGSLLELLERSNGTSTLEERERFAAEAFNVSSHYDSAIFAYFNRREEIPAFKVSETQSVPLRYGENPHQKAHFFGDPAALPGQLWGKELSYNNLLDLEASLELIADFGDPSVAIIKHNNACGCASRNNLKEAWEAALAADPVSAYGGVIVANRVVDAATALEMNKIFFEIVSAPGYEPEALEILKEKKNRIILVSADTRLSARKYRSLLGGTLVQERDSYVEKPDDLTVVTTLKPTEKEIADLLFANKIVKHSKSNTIVLAKDNTLLASGIGQTSRVDALKQAIIKAGEFGFSLEGAVMASDAFFPFPDCVEIAGNAGIKAVIQPGGSIRDKESTDYCNNNGIAMVTTGIRHFKH